MQSRTPQINAGKAKTRANKDKRASPKSTSSRCDLIFPVARILRMYKQGKYSSTVQRGAAIFTAAVMEYIACEILELAGNAAAEHKKERIQPRHLQLAIRNDDELNKLMATTTIASGGVLPNIEKILFAKKGKKAAAAETSATQEM